MCLRKREFHIWLKTDPVYLKCFSGPAVWSFIWTWWTGCFCSMRVHLSMGTFQNSFRVEKGLVEYGTFQRNGWGYSRKLLLTQVPFIRHPFPLCLSVSLPFMPFVWAVYSNSPVLGSFHVLPSKDCLLIHKPQNSRILLFGVFSVLYSM